MNYQYPPNNQVFWRKIFIIVIVTLTCLGIAYIYKNHNSSSTTAPTISQVSDDEPFNLYRPNSTPLNKIISRIESFFRDETDKIKTLQHNLITPILSQNITLTPQEIEYKYILLIKDIFNSLELSLKDSENYQHFQETLNSNSDFIELIHCLKDKKLTEELKQKILELKELKEYSLTNCFDSPQDKDIITQIIQIFEKYKQINQPIETNTLPHDNNSENQSPSSPEAEHLTTCKDIQDFVQQLNQPKEITKTKKVILYNLCKKIIKLEESKTSFIEKNNQQLLELLQPVLKKMDQSITSQPNEVLLLTSEATTSQHTERFDKNKFIYEIKLQLEKLNRICFSSEICEKYFIILDFFKNQENNINHQTIKELYNFFLRLKDIPLFKENLDNKIINNHTIIQEFITSYYKLLSEIENYLK